MDTNENSAISSITPVAMTAYISFSVIFFIVCLFNDWSVLQYLLMFLVFTFIIQFGINLWAAQKVCPDPTGKSNLDIGKSLSLTFVPWMFILVLVSFLLYVMPGWVRVFSNTIGLAVVRSVYGDLFKNHNDVTNGPANGTLNRPVNVTENVQVNVVIAPDDIDPKLLQDIYHDPSKLINEVEYLPDFAEWKAKIFDGYLSKLPYFKDTYFMNDNIPAKLFTGDGNEKVPNKDNHIYQLYKCVATKEKIGYFTWLFLSGAIFTLTSLSQIYESTC